jgi:O-succinylbenzoic acid--CoA ligase
MVSLCVFRAPLHLHNDTKYDFVAMVPLQAQNSLSALKNVKNDSGGVKMSKILENGLSN